MPPSNSPNNDINTNFLMRVLGTILFACATAWAGWISTTAMDNGAKHAAYEQRMSQYDKDLRSINTKLDLLLERSLQGCQDARR